MSPAVTAEPTSTRRPVARDEAAGYLTLLVVAFVVTVTVTRVFLAATGYPRIGGSTFHLAHALWGGLLLVVGVVVELLWANRWALRVAAVCAGIGVGLFIDEVGKFITTRNDYFFPLAAPIVYLAMVILGWIAFRARRRRAPTDRERLYDVLDGLQDLADGRLDSDRRAAIIAHLGHLRDEWDRPELRELSARLEEFLLSPVVTVLPARPSLLRRARARLGRMEQRLLSERWLRRILTAFLVVGTAAQLIGIAVAVVVLVHPASWKEQLDEAVAGTELDRTLVSGVFVIQLGSAFVGFALFATALTSWFHRRRLRAIRIMVVTQLISLSLIDVVQSYVEQFGVLQQSVFDLLLLGLLLRYRARFLPDTPVAPRLDDEPAGRSSAARERTPDHAG
jgi:anti-sigma factor RsiW